MFLKIEIKVCFLVSLVSLHSSTMCILALSPSIGSWHFLQYDSSIFTSVTWRTPPLKYFPMNSQHPLHKEKQKNFKHKTIKHLFIHCTTTISYNSISIRHNVEQRSVQRQITMNNDRWIHQRWFQRSDLVVRHHCRSAMLHID